MNSELTAYITLICTSGVLTLYLGCYVFAKRYNYNTIANYFIFYTASLAIYCFGSGISLTTSTIEQMKFWTIFQYVGMPLSSPLGLMFVMKYLGIKITKLRGTALLIIPITSFLMVATNDFHSLHYRVFEIDPNLGAPYVHLEIGMWYTIHGIYTFACMFVAFLLVLFRWRETSRDYRPQLVALMFGQLVPMVTAFVYLIGLTPAGIDPVPLVLWLSSLLYLWSINSSRMFSIMPIAKNAIFNSINDGVMVLDESYRLIEFNNACRSMFPQLNNSMFGRNFNKVWLMLTGASFPSGLETTQEIHLTVNNSKLTYQIRTAPLQHGNNKKGLLIIFTDITEIKSLQIKLEHQAYYDELTQIFNRRAFFQKCEQGFATAKEELSPFTVILIDIDYFKTVNDTYGHYTGDLLLKHIVQVCQSQLNEEMLFARYGGEEFVIALKGRTAIEGETLANQLRLYLETQPLITKEDVITVTFSCGVAEATNEEGETLYQLLNRADKALYTAKREGRNQVQVYTQKNKVST